MCDGVKERGHANERDRNHDRHAGGVRFQTRLPDSAPRPPAPPATVPSLPLPPGLGILGCLFHPPPSPLFVPPSTRPFTPPPPLAFLTPAHRLNLFIRSFPFLRAIPPLFPPGSPVIFPQPCNSSPSKSPPSPTPTRRHNAHALSHATTTHHFYPPSPIPQTTKPPLAGHTTPSFTRGPRGVFTYQPPRLPRWHPSSLFFPLK